VEDAGCSSLGSEAITPIRKIGAGCCIEDLDGRCVDAASFPSGTGGQAAMYFLRNEEQELFHESMMA
jgi:hypothetical protein